MAVFLLFKKRPEYATLHKHFNRLMAKQDLWKIASPRHADASPRLRPVSYQEHIENTGFRIKKGMTRGQSG
jgi:hypothetical protein